MASEKQWYVVNTYSGHENKVKDNLLKRIETQDLTDYIFRVIVAEQEVPVLNKEGLPSGKVKMKNIFPGLFNVFKTRNDLSMGSIGCFLSKVTHHHIV